MWDAFKKKKGKEAADDDVHDAGEARQSGQQVGSAAPHARHGTRDRQSLEEHQQVDSESFGESHHGLVADKHFDQIAFHDPRNRLKASKGGVFDFQQVIYGPDEAEKYRSAMERSAPDKVEESASSAKASGQVL